MNAIPAIVAGVEEIAMVVPPAPDGSIDPHVLAAAAGAEDAEATAKSLAKVRESDLTDALEQLAREHETAARSYRLACVAGSWQFVTQPDYGPWLRALVVANAVFRA